MSNNKKLNALALSGSPRKNGNTNYLINQILETLDYEPSLVYLHNKDIKPCSDCRGCKKEPFDCIVKDEMPEIYSKLESSDVLIFGTPIYWFTPSAQMKLLIDRLRPYYGNKKLNGKKAVVVTVAGVGPKDCDLTEEMFKKTFAALGIEFIGIIKAKAFDIDEVKNDKEAFARLNDICEKLKS